MTTSEKNIFQKYLEGRVGRRDFITRVLMIGMTAGGLETFLAACGGQTSTSSNTTPQRKYDMSLQTNKELWKSWSALWNGNLSIADEIIAPNFVAHFAPIGNSPAEVHGPDGLTQWIVATGAAFIDYSLTTIVGPLADEDYVAGRWLFRATYQGGMPGASPSAVGKRVEYAGTDIFRVEAGKIVEYWLSADTLQLLQQVGMFPS